MSAHSGLPATVRKLGKTAGLSARESDELLLDALAGGMGLNRAVKGFIEKMWDLLVERAQDNPRYHDALIAGPFTAR